MKRRSLLPLGKPHFPPLRPEKGPRVKEGKTPEDGVRQPWSAKACLRFHETTASRRTANG
ncbi:MAG: hypothetical protein ACUVTH_10595 [Thermogutta sp.]